MIGFDGAGSGPGLQPVPIVNCFSPVLSDSTTTRDIEVVDEPRLTDARQVAVAPGRAPEHLAWAQRRRGGADLPGLVGDVMAGLADREQNWARFSPS